MQQLPAKDQAVFRSIVKFYEQKQYKKGLKAADSILKKHPDHGETLCMKGLTLSYLDKKEEAYELVRKGLKMDVKSHVCWHVYGLLHRQDREYSEAIKCYHQALRRDADNLQILRDLSLLQIHQRDLIGFAETRRKLLQVKPGNRLHWVGYAVAEHLCKNHEFAWNCIDHFEKTFKDDTVTPYENSELHLYKATIMEEAGKYEEALETLKQQESQIVDKLGLLEMKGRICMFLHRYDEAAEIYRRLVKLNPEHHVYILAYMANLPKFHRFWPALPAPVEGQNGVDEAAKGSSEAKVPSTICSFPASMHPLGMPIWGWLPPQHALKPNRRMTIGHRMHKRRVDSYEPLCELTEDEERLVIDFFEGLQRDHPSSDSLKRIPLYFLTGRRFQKRLDSYLRSRLRKGVPSLFRMLRGLYFQKGKPELIQELLEQYVQCLEEEVPWFGPVPSEEGSGEAVRLPPKMGEDEPPSSLLFTHMVLAEHYNFMGDTTKALGHADAAIKHTPTLVEIYACKAKILRHAGDLEESANCAEEVRKMDLADRFLNTQCVRALLRKDDTKQGMEKALLFSKEPDSPEAANLHDMQCMWYESAVGRSYCRQKKPGKALKKFNETFKHFNDIAEDQFDFHNYCLRKTTLKAYVAMLRMQERLYSHKFYRRASRDAIRIYLQLFDDKVRAEAEGAAAGGSAGQEAELSAAEKKKQKHKLKREKAKEESVPSKASNETTKSASGKPRKVDDDPEGEKLLEKDPMEEASKLVRTLVTYCDLDMATHVLTYEVFSRQGKLVLSLHALRRIWELSGHDALFYKLIAPLSHFCFVASKRLEAGQDEENAVNPAVTEVLLSEIAPLLVRKDEGHSPESATPFSSVEALRAAAQKMVDAVESRLKAKADLPLIEVLYSLKCLKHAGRDCKSFLTTWQSESAFSLKECQKLLAFLGQEYGRDSVIWERFKARCTEVFPRMVIA